MSDVDVRALATRLARVEAALRSRGEQLAYSSLEDGALREFSLEGTQVAQYGQQYDGTSTAATLVSPEPPAPSDPTTRNIAGGIVVAWDGTFEGDLSIVAPMDLARIDVVAGAVGFDPIATPPMHSFTSPRGSEVLLPLLPGDYEVALVTRTLAGRPSEPSARVAGTALPLVDPEQFADALTELEDARTRLTAAEGDITASEGEITAAKARLDAAEQDVIDALAAAAAAQATADASITVYRQSSAPVSGMGTNDLWIDSDDGLLYVWTGSWTLSADQRIAAVVASNSMKTTLFSQTSMPSTSGRTDGDMWIDTDDGNKVYTWISGAWTARLLGNSALSDLDVNKLTVVGVANVDLLVAQAIEAKTAAFQRADIGNLTVAGTSTLDTVVAQQLAAQTAEFVRVTADNMTAGAVQATHLASVLALVTKICSSETGRRWEADAAGIRVYESDGTILINFPTDPNTPSSFYGDLTASSLTVVDQLALRGLVNEISKGAQVVIASGTTAPSSAPVITVDWEQVDTAVADGDPDYAGYNAPRYGWVRWTRTGHAQRWWTAQSVYGASATLNPYLDNGDGEAFGGSFSTDLTGAQGGLAVVGANIYVLGKKYTDLVNYTWRVQGYSPAGVQISDWQYIPAGNSREPRLATDGTNLIIAYSTTTANTLIWQYRNPATGTAVGGAVSSGLTVNKEMNFLWGGAADFGEQRVCVNLTGEATVRTLTSAGVLTPNDDFPTASTTVKGMDYYGGVFYTHDPSSHTLTKHTSTVWQAESATWYVSNTWYDGDATGGTHETAQGPRKPFVMKKRARLNVTTAILPVRPIPNTTDDAKAARIYIGRGAADPGRTFMDRMVTLADGMRNWTSSAIALVANAAASPAPITAASPPPSASDFPASSPGKITSADGVRIVLQGDGSAAIGGLSVTSAGVTTLTATEVVIGTQSVGRGLVPGGHLEVGVSAGMASGTIADVASGSVTVSLLSTRKYKLSLITHAKSTVANDRVTIQIREGTTVMAFNQSPQLVTQGSYYTIDCWGVVDGPTTGSHTFKISLARLSGTGTVNLTTSTLLVEDIGAAGT